MVKVLGLVAAIMLLLALSATVLFGGGGQLRHVPPPHSLSDGTAAQSPVAPVAKGPRSW